MSDQIEPSRLERVCVERGMKMTGQRRVIARVLSDANDHPDVEELYRRSMESDSKISIATVYRTVRLFEEAGLLDRLHITVAPLLIGSGRPSITLDPVASLDQVLRPPCRHFRLGRDVLFDLDLRSEPA